MLKKLINKARFPRLMVHKKYGEESISEWDREKVKSYFQSIGITDIPSFSGNVMERMLEGARFFAQHHYHGFSAAELAALIFLNDGWSPERAIGFQRAVANHIKRRYKTVDMESLQRELGDIPVTQLLRIETGNYEGNLHELMGYVIDEGKLVKAFERKEYPLLRISREDWREGIRLPTPEETDQEYAAWFGLFWAIGNISRLSDRSYNVVMQINASRGEGVEEIVKRLTKKLFNIDMWSYPYEGRDIERGGTTLSYSGTVLTKASMALSSFLMYHHNFPCKNRGRTPERVPRPHLPSLNWTKEILDGFIIGIMLGRGRDAHYEYSYPYRKRMVKDTIFLHGKGTYGHNLSRLLSMMDVRHHIRHRKRSNWIIYFHEEETAYYRRLYKGFAEQHRTATAAQKQAEPQYQREESHRLEVMG